MIRIRALPGACRASTEPGLSDFGFPDWFGKWSHRVFRRSPRIIGMKRYDAQISFAAVVERIAPEVPRYVVYSGEAWDETGTFLVEVALNGIPIGLRSMIPWKIGMAFWTVGTDMPQGGGGDWRSRASRNAQGWRYPTTRATGTLGQQSQGMEGLGVIIGRRTARLRVVCCRCQETRDS